MAFVDDFDWEISKELGLKFNITSSIKILNKFHVSHF